MRSMQEVRGVQEVEEVHSALAHQEMKTFCSVCVNENTPGA